MSERKPTRASCAHERDDLRVDNPLYDRAGSLCEAFQARRAREEVDGAARRESFMVKRQQPKPTLRPSRALALGPDGAAFDSQWQEERATARPVHRDRQD